MQTNPTNPTNPNSLVVKPPVAESLLCENGCPLLDEPAEKSEEVSGGGVEIRGVEIGGGEIRERGAINMDELMDKLEREGMEKVQKVWTTPLASPITSPITSNIFQQIMQDGADEFKATTGRNMTYSELRSLYG